jgi:hypothetical protein
MIRPRVRGGSRNGPGRLGIRPRPAPAAVRGVLAMSDDELTAFIRDNKIDFPTPTPGSEVEAQWEATLFKAIESGEIGREKPGRRKGRSEERDAEYLAFAEKCRDEADANIALTRTKFLDGAEKTLHITRDTAEDRWPSLRKKISQKPAEAYP